MRIDAPHPAKAAPGEAEKGAAPRRVLVVAPQPFYEDRGTPIAIRYLLEALAELGFAADLLTFPTGRPLEIPGVRVCRTPNPLGFRSVPIGFSYRKLLLDLLLARELRTRLRHEAYLYAHVVEEAAFLAALLRRGGKPFLVYDMASSLPEQLEQHRLFRGRIVQAVCRRLERWLLARVDFVLCSAGLGDRVRRLAPATPREEWLFPAVLPPVSAGDAAACREALGLPADALVFLYSGSFAAYQGLPLLLEAAPRVLGRVPEAFLVLVGAATEDEVARTREAVPEPLRERVRVMPRVPRERIHPYLAMADILVSPRCHGRNLPLKIFDYLASGRAIVATDIPAHRTVLDDRIALLTDRSADGIAAAVLRLLRDPAERQRLAAAAGHFAATRLSWARLVDQIGGVTRAAGSGIGEAGPVPSGETAPAGGPRRG